MNKFIPIILIVFLMSFFTPGVKADIGQGSTIVRERTENDDGGTTSDWAFGDIANQAGDGIDVTTVEVELTNFVGARHRWSVNDAYINALISSSSTSINGLDGINVTGTGTVVDPFQFSAVASDMTGASIGSFENNFLINTDGIDDTMIDFGTGANQVSATDVPIADAGGYYTGTEVETALQEVGAGGIGPAGSDTQVQFNDSGAFGADADFWYDNNTDTLALGQSASVTADLSLSAVSGVASETAVTAPDIIAGDATTVGEIFYYDGDGERLKEYVTDIASDVNLDKSALGAWTNGYLISLDTTNNPYIYVEVDPSSVGVDTLGYVLTGFMDTGNGTDTFAYAPPLPTTPYSNTFGLKVPFNATITDISATAEDLNDADDVITLDIMVYEDGNPVNASCELQLPEGSPTAAYANFSPGTYTVTAGGVIAIWLDFVNDTPASFPPSLTNLIVTVYYNDNS